MAVEIERRPCGDSGRTPGSYEFVVRFTRNAEEDEAIVGSADPMAHVQQFVRELQEYAFDDGAMAGSFQVERAIIYE